MRTIHKLQIEEDIMGCDLLLPAGAVFLHVGMQKQKMQMWWEYNSEAPRKLRRFRVVPTGFEIGNAHWKHLETFFENGGEFVWHLYEIGDLE